MPRQAKKYKVVKVIGMRKIGANIDYRVYWKGYAKPTWVPYENMEECDELIMEYTKAQLKKNRQQKGVGETSSVQKTYVGKNSGSRGHVGESMGNKVRAAKIVAQKLPIKWAVNNPRDVLAKSSQSGNAISIAGEAAIMAEITAETAKCDVEESVKEDEKCTLGNSKDEEKHEESIKSNAEHVQEINNTEMAMESDDSKSENGTTPKLSNVGNNNQAIGNKAEGGENKYGCPNENEIVESGGEADEDVGYKEEVGGNHILDEKNDGSKEVGTEDPDKNRNIEDISVAKHFDEESAAFENANAVVEDNAAGKDADENQAKQDGGE